MRVLALALVLLATVLLFAFAESPPEGDRVLAPTLLVQLAVSDLDRSIRFYTELLGCRMTERRDDLEFAHVDCGQPGVTLGLSAGGSQPPSAGTIVLNFGVEGEIELARRVLESRGIVFTEATRSIPGKVRLAPFRDPDGYMLRLAGPDRGAS